MIEINISNESIFSSPLGVRGRLLIIAFTFTFVLEAQNLIIDGEIRPRTEYQDGYSKPLTTANDPGIFTTQRTRLNFAYNSGVLNTLVSLQDARVFGQDAQASSTATVCIYEAWADVLLFPGATLKIGRQAVKYDDTRLFSSPAWSNTGTSHDMALLKYNINDWQFHLAAAFNNKSAIASETFYTPGAKYRAMNILYVSKPLFGGLSFSAIMIDEGMQDTVGVGTAYKKLDMNHCYTFGGNLKYQDEKVPVSALATAYFQSGKSATGKTMRGKLLALKADYKFSDAITASIGTDYLSGDANGTTDGIQSNFKKLYGADHTFNGYMDYWNIPPTEGLLDYYASGTAKFGKKLSLEFAYHLFNTDKPLKNRGVEVRKDLGSEIDFLITYKINNWSTVQGGYCRYFETPNTLLAKNINTVIRMPQWAYVMFTFKIIPSKNSTV
jgi:hypothetical protein